MKDHLDWIEVRGILRQIAQACADCLDGVFDAKDFVGGKVVHHHNVSALERRSQTLLEVGQKDFAVHCSVDQHRRDYSGETQARNEGHGLPVAQWHISDQALSARTAAIRSHHVGADRAKAPYGFHRFVSCASPKRLVMTSPLKKSLRAAEQQRADVARARRRWIREQGLLYPAS